MVGVNYAPATKDRGKDMENQITPRGMSEANAACYLGLSRSTLRQGRMDGRREKRAGSPAFVRVGRKIIYLRDDLDRWLEANRQTNCSAVAS